MTRYGTSVAAHRIAKDYPFATLAQLGEARVPTTSGILIGIGETEAERIEALLMLRELHDRHGHIQEIIVQNFRAKSGTRMARYPEPTQEDLVRTVALARLIFGGTTSIQVPPNLNPEGIAAIVDSGIDDWGGISPLTIDFVNPEAPWPNVDRLEQQLRGMKRELVERTTIYPDYSRDAKAWLDTRVAPAVLRVSDAEALGRDDDWRAGGDRPPPTATLALLDDDHAQASRPIARFSTGPRANGRWRSTRSNGCFVRAARTSARSAAPQMRCVRPPLATR